jgi:hypothetical protein
MEGYGQPHEKPRASERGTAARLTAERDRLKTENDQFRVVLRQVRGHVITHEARRVIDRALKGVPGDR